MKTAGLLLLPSGWFIVLSAIALLSGPARTGFALAGCAVELLGLTLLVRSHIASRGFDR
ncbi:MAG TPA: hypothetical protein VF146_15450 [Bryobacteraceae bacterium]